MNIIKSLPTPLNEPYNLPLYSLSSFTLPSTTTIEKLLSAVNTSSELDPIPHSILNKYHIYLESYYQEIIENSLTSGIFPIYMKTAYVTPIIKKPNLDKAILSNYRPISNLSTLSKTLERVVARQLNSYLHENHILNPYQSAYTKHKSTETAIIHILNHIHLSAASPHGSVVILLDLSAAFDTLDHNILINRLTSIGISDTALDWFISYLTDRFYQISINSLISKPRKVTHGVPQGSVLGPLLFNIYLLPLFKIIDKYPTIDYHSYADDIQLHCRLIDPNNDINLLNNCITDIHNWLTNNSLSLNCLKTESMHIKTSTTIFIPPQITINNLSISYANKIKNLGILIDPTLQFNIQTKSLSQSINYILHNLRTIRPFINFNTAKLLATSLILPRLDYCNSCLYASSQSIINKLQRLQNSAIRFIFNITKYSRQHISPLRTKLHWLPIKSRIIYKIALTIHLATHHNTPDYLANLLTPNTTIYEQRHINKFKLKTPVLLHLTSSQHKSFSIHAPKIWNDLPHHIRSIDSTVTFKSKLKTYLFAQ